MLGLGLGLTSPAALWGGVAAPAGPWTPLDLGVKLACWFNADDTVNGAVASWTARVGGQVVTATAGLEPISAATSFNSAYRGVTFDGTDDCLVLAATTGLPVGATAGEMWIIANEAAPSALRIPLAYGGATAGTSRQFRRNSGTSRLGISDGTVILADTVILYSGYHIAGGYFSGTTMGGRIDGRDTNPATTTIATMTTGTTRLRLGASNATAAANFWQGSIRHVLVTTLLTGTEREKLEGWLAHDSALTSVLPVGHPYKSSPP